MLTSPAFKVLSNCVAKEMRVLFKRCLSEQVTRLSDKTIGGRWFVNYAYNYFQSNTKYVAMFVIPHRSPNVRVFDRGAFSIERDSNKVSLQKLCQILHYIAESNSKNLLRKQLQKFDKQSVMLLQSRLETSASILLLSSWHVAFGKALFETSFYESLCQTWTRTACACSIQELVAMLFFLGQSKHPPKILITSILKRLEELHSEPTFDEWTIICHNFFVMKTELSPPILHHVLKLTCQLLPNIERFQLIAILKALRHSRYPIDPLLSPLSDFILQTYGEYIFVECTNFLATYANAGSYHQDVFGKLESHIFAKPLPELLPTPFFPDVHRLHPSVRARSKDVARLLWAFAHTRHDIAPESLQQLTKILRRKISEGDFQNSPHHLVDCLQSLILYGVYPYDLLDHVLEKTFVNLCINTKKAKPCHQLFFINRSIEIECQDYKGNRISRELLQKLGTYLVRSPTTQLSFRNGSSALISLLNDHYGARNGRTKYVSVLPHIPIAGAVIYLDKEMPFPVAFPLEDEELADSRWLFSSALDLTRVVCFEVTDASVTIGTRPNGLLATKVRQLKKLGCKVVSLSPDDVLELSRHADVKEKIKNFFLSKV